jgi:hypothetical protein
VIFILVRSKVQEYCIIDAVLAASSHYTFVFSILWVVGQLPMWVGPWPEVIRPDEWHNRSKSTSKSTAGRNETGHGVYTNEIPRHWTFSFVYTSHNFPRCSSTTSSRSSKHVTFAKPYPIHIIVLPLSSYILRSLSTWLNTLLQS